MLHIDERLVPIFLGTCKLKHKTDCYGSGFLKSGSESAKKPRFIRIGNADFYPPYLLILFFKSGFATLVLCDCLFCVSVLGIKNGCINVSFQHAGREAEHEPGGRRAVDRQPDQKRQAGRQDRLQAGHCCHGRGHQLPLPAAH